MPTPQPAYPTQRAFVVQLHVEADVTQGEGRGGAGRAYCVGAGDALRDR